MSRFKQIIMRLWRYWSTPWRSMLLTAMLTAVSCAAVTAISRVPVPFVHDETAYLMAAESFADGRITNPTPAAWEHFETFHVVYEPTMQMKYPPAQSISLALGMKLGHPIIGVWLSCVFMACSVLWMLQAFTRPRWALLGAGIVILQFASASYWAQSYWGGAIQAGAAAFAFGAAKRIASSGQSTPHRKKNLMCYSFLLGAALIMLANSRPFEGAMVGIVAACMLLRWGINCVRNKNKSALVQVAWPVLTVFVVGLTLMGAYHHKITGSATKMPYMLHNDQYAAAPQFIFLDKPPQPTYNHAVFQDYIERYDITEYERKQTPSGFITQNLHYAGRAWTFYAGIALTIPLVLIPWIAFKRRETRPAMAVICLVLAGHSVVFAYQEHYTAPAVAMYILLLVCVFRMIHTSKISIGKRRLGPIALALLLTTLLAQTTFRVYQHRQKMAYDGYWYMNRQTVESDLKQWKDPDDNIRKHIAIVRYGKEHSFYCEYVFNHADFENSRVLFARDMGDVANAELEKHYPDRKLWLVDVFNDTKMPTVTPYTPNTAKHSVSSDHKKESQ